jgi:hypothetical protein
MIEGSRSGSIPLTNGSGTGPGRPKIMWIRIRIRIRNTWLATESVLSRGVPGEVFLQRQMFCTAKVSRLVVILLAFSVYRTRRKIRLTESNAKCWVGYTLVYIVTRYYVCLLIPVCVLRGKSSKWFEPSSSCFGGFYMPVYWEPSFWIRTIYSLDICVFFNVGILKKLPVKGLCGRCLSVWGPKPIPPPLTHCIRV